MSSHRHLPRPHGAQKNPWIRLAVLITGSLSIIWYAIRVVPRPARAAYPCQRAAAPLRAGFIAYLAALAVSTFSMRNVKRLFRQREFLRAALLLPMVCLPLIIVYDHGAQALTSTANAPIGVARGIFPGRVAWVFAPSAALWTGSGNYWAASVNPQAEYNKAFTAGIMALSGGSSEADAWDRIFKWFNAAHGRSGTGYTPGDKIAVKINQNNAPVSAADIGNTVNANPQSVVACVASLVHGGVAQTDIIVGDPSRAVTDNIFNAVHAAFPNVQVVDFFGNNGRITSAVTMGAFPGGAADLLPDSEATCFYAARYLINMPLMKGHTGQIFTFGAKNFYGITGINSDWTKNGGHHPYTASLTNFMISPNFGGKVILWCMDAMYPDANLDGTPDSGWAEAPFNGKPMSSFIMSLDGVAEESVSADFFSNHYGTGTTGQDYIVDAADSGAGVEEHWNNPVAKQYSRNLDSVKGTGIQLVRVQGDAVLPARGASQAPLLSIRRSGAALLLIVPRAGEYHLSIITLNGRVAFREVKHYAAAGSVTVPLARLNLPHGAYMAEVKSAGATISSRVEL